MRYAYRHTTFKPWRLVAWALRTLRSVLNLWPLLLIAWCVVSPVSPHLLWIWTYEPLGHARLVDRCVYLGASGFIEIRAAGECPLLDLIDRR